MSERLETKPRRIRPGRWLLAFAAFVALGYASDMMTLSACDAATDRWLRGILATHAGQRDWPGRRALAEPATFRAPWFAEVQYEWAVGPTGAEWGTRTYLCLFGLAIPVRNRVHMMA